MSDLVSVIICTNNRKALVSRAIESALIQVDCNLDIIVIDDCSDDGTVEHLSRLYSGHIKLLSTETNSGRAVASNLGFRHSTGNYIALLDDDDYWIDSCKLKKQIDVMQSNSSLGVLGTWWIELKPSGRKEDKKPVPPRNRYFLIEKLLMSGGIVSGSSPLITREAWDKVGGMDTTQLKGIDSDLYRRIALAGYGVDVLSEITTAADAAHGYDRMTSLSDKRKLLRSIKGNINVLRKNNVLFLLYPRALAVRLKRLIIGTMRYVSQT